MRQTTVTVFLVLFVFWPSFTQGQTPPCTLEDRNAWTVAFDFPKAEQAGQLSMLTPEALLNPLNVTTGYEAAIESFAARSNELKALQGKLFSKLTIYWNRCNDARMSVTLWQEPQIAPKPLPQTAAAKEQDRGKRDKTFRMKGRWW